MRKEIKRVLTDEVMTAQEAADYLGIHSTNLRVRVHRKKIKAVNRGNMLLLDREDVENAKKEG